MKKRDQQSWPVALCGMAVAVSVVLMLLGAIIPVAMFIAPAAGGILIGAVAVECGPRWAWTAYGAAGLLGLFVVPDKETALVFVFLLGYYPLVKPRLDRIRPAPLRVGAKLLLCNGAVLLLYGLLYLLFPAGQGSDAFQLAAVALAAVTLAIGNAAFLLFDRALTNLLRVYKLLWQPRLHKMLGKR